MVQLATHTFKWLGLLDFFFLRNVLRLFDFGFLCVSLGSLSLSLFARDVEIGTDSESSELRLLGTSMAGLGGAEMSLVGCVSGNRK